MKRYGFAASVLLLLAIAAPAQAQQGGRYQLLELPGATVGGPSAAILLDTVSGKTWRYADLSQYKGSLAISRQKVWRPVQYLTQGDDGGLRFRPLPPGKEAGNRRASQKPRVAPARAQPNAYRDASRPAGRTLSTEELIPIAFQPGDYSGGGTVPTRFIN